MYIGVIFPINYTTFTLKTRHIVFLLYVTHGRKFSKKTKTKTFSMSKNYHESQVILSPLECGDAEACSFSS